MRQLVLATLILSGCQTSMQSERWLLSTGDQIICEKYEQTECGLSLKGCGDERTVDLECVIEAKYLGPGEYFEPEIYDEKPKGKCK